MANLLHVRVVWRGFCRWWYAKNSLRTMTEKDKTIARNNLFFRQLLFLGLLIFIGMVIVRELDFVIGSFLGAITMYVVFRPWQFRLVGAYHWRPWMASLLLVTFATLLLAALLFGLFRVIAAELLSIDFGALMSGLDNFVARINRHLPFDLADSRYIAESSDYLARAAGSIINTTYSFVINMLFTMVLLYFMLADAQRLERRVARYNPFKGENRTAMMREVSNIIYSNAVGIPIIMIGQGLAAALIYWLFGIQQVAFWAFMTAVAGLIPVVGSVIISLPLGVSIIASGKMWQGIVLILCGLLIIANVDNLLRIILNRKMTDIHPLIVIFGVLMGIPFFGFWGIIFGPLLISMFLLLVKIYYREFKLMSPKEIQEEYYDDLAAKNKSRRKKF